MLKKSVTAPLIEVSVPCAIKTFTLECLVPFPCVSFNINNKLGAY